MFILSFVLKRLMKLRTFLVLNRVRVSKPQRLTQILVQYPPPLFTPRDLYSLRIGVLIFCPNPLSETKIPKIVTPKRDDEHPCPFSNVHDGMYWI